MKRTVGNNHDGVPCPHKGCKYVNRDVCSDLEIHFDGRIAHFEKECFFCRRPVCYEAIFQGHDVDEAKIRAYPTSNLEKVFEMAMAAIN